MSNTYRGSCHCGRVTFELRGEPGRAIDCNCSLCHRKGALWYGPDANLHILSGESDLTLYQFNTMTAKHYFCSHCGISTFSRARIAPTKWMVNLRCIDGIDLSKIEVIAFDGQHWEDAVNAARTRALPRESST